MPFWCRQVHCHDCTNNCSAIHRIGGIPNNCKCLWIQVGREPAGGSTAVFRLILSIPRSLDLTSSVAGTGLSSHQSRSSGHRAAVFTILGETKPAWRLWHLRHACMESRRAWMVVLGTDSSRKAAFATPGRPLKKRSELSLTAQFGPILPVPPGGIAGRESGREHRSPGVREPTSICSWFRDGVTQTPQGLGLGPSPRSVRSCLLRLSLPVSAGTRPVGVSISLPILRAVAIAQQDSRSPTPSKKDYSREF